MLAEHQLVSLPADVLGQVGEDGQELPRGQIGRLAVTGPTGCLYLDDERQRHYVKDGWNYPGDAFLQDEAGVPNEAQASFEAHSFTANA